jgi:5-methylcytosine-specific restriction enzyme subunit McrC
LSVPLDKIFLMLTYAAGHADMHSLVSVATGGIGSYSDYLARALAEAGEQSLRRGVPQQYNSRQIVGRSLRGRLDFPRQIRMDLLSKPALCCIADQLGHNAALSTLMKAAALQLARIPMVSETSAARLRRLASSIACEPPLRVSVRHWKAVRHLRLTGVHSAAAFISWLVLGEQAFADGDDALMFGWPKTDQQLGRLFQEFVRACLDVEYGGLGHVHGEDYWLGPNLPAPRPRTILPLFRSDVVLKSDSDILVIEAKLQCPLVESGRSEASSPKLRTDDISQLFAYLHHASRRYPTHRVRGVLIYGAEADAIAARFSMGDHEIAVLSVDLRSTADEVLKQVRRLAAWHQNASSFPVALGEAALGDHTRLQLYSSAERSINL